MSISGLPLPKRWLLGSEKLSWISCRNTPCPRKNASVFVSLISTSNLAQNSCPGTVLKSAGNQLSNAPPEI